MRKLAKQLAKILLARMPSCGNQAILHAQRLIGRSRRQPLRCMSHWDTWHEDFFFHIGAMVLQACG